MNEKQPFSEKTLSEKQYVLGRKEKTNKGILNIGRYYALDGSLGANVYIDILRPHVILICGKRGYGKSYTIGVFLEELARLDPDVKNNLGVIVFDTLGIFWSSRYKNKEEIEQLKKWGIQPDAIDIRLLAPIKFLEQYKKQNIEASGFSIPIHDLTPYHWCQLFSVKPTDPLGIVITRAILQLKQTQKPFSIPDIIKFIQSDVKSEQSMKVAAENFFTMADAWGIFDKQGTPISEIVQRGTLSIIDFSHLPTSQLKSITAALIGEHIFEARIQERKIHEAKKIGFDVQEAGMPMVLLAIDEAQLFIPNDEELLSKNIFINEWMRQGRQPGLSLIMATQRPSALATEVLSHSDIILCHRLTAQEDIDALSKIRPTYMSGDIKESIKKIGDEKGVALIIDDTSESSHVIKIRPRISWHGGSESRVLEPTSQY